MKSIILSLAVLCGALAFTSAYITGNECAVNEGEVAGLIPFADAVAGKEPMISGMAASRTMDGVAWFTTKNEDPATPTEAIINAVEIASGEIVGTATLSGVTVNNLLDIAISMEGENSFIYLADTAEGMSQTIYKFAEPSMPDGEDTFDVTIKAKDFETFNLVGDQDEVQAIMVDSNDNGKVYMITSGTVEPMLRSFKTLSEEKANKVVKDEGPINFAGVVAADMSDDGEKILLKTDLQTYMLIKKDDDDVYATFTSTNVCVMSEVELENDSAIAFAKDMKSYYSSGAAYQPNNATLPVAPPAERVVPVDPFMRSDIYQFTFGDDSSSNTDDPSNPDEGTDGASSLSFSLIIAVVSVALARMA